MTSYPSDIEDLLGPTPHDAVHGAPPAVVDAQPIGGASMGNPAVPLVPAFVGSAYDGAGRFDDQLMLWQPGLGSADLDVLPVKPFIDARVRDSLRNDAYILNGSELHKDNIVGAHFLLNAKPALKPLALIDKTFDESWETEFQEEVETLHTLWGESPNNWVDASSINTFTELVRLAVGIWVMAKEVLATAEWIKDGRPFNTAIQMIDLDRLSNPYGMFDNPLLRGGVVRNLAGAPQAYHIRLAHPADFTNFANFNAYSWKQVPVKKPWGRLQVLHIIDQERPDQSRGISMMVAALKEMRITKKFRDVTLQNAVVNATYAATIESELPTGQVFQQLGGGNVDEEAMKAAITQYATGYLGAISRYAGGARGMAIDGVKIPHLFPGTKLQLRPAGQGGPLGSEFESSLLRYIAAGLGVSYEQLAKDYSKTNYSSAKAAGAETLKAMQSRKRRVADRFASTIYRLWLEEAINKNALTTLPAKKAPIFYTGGVLNLAFEAVSSCSWIGASRGQIDELKETQAAIQRLLFGLSTWEDELGRLGKDWRKVFAQLQREQADMKTRDILQNMQSNMANAVQGAAGPKEPGEATTNTGGSKALHDLQRAMMAAATSATSGGME